MTTINSDSKVNIQSEGWWFFRVFDSDSKSVTLEPDDRTPVNFVFIPVFGRKYTLTVGDAVITYPKDIRVEQTTVTLSPTQSSYI